MPRVPPKEPTLSENVQIAIGIVILVVVFILTRIVIMRKMQKAAARLIQDLEKRGAVDIMSGVELPYAKPNILRVGLRDYRAKALECLVSEGVIGQTEGGKYYLLATRRPGR